MCTKDDLTELQRATHLLRKGYEIQKLAVSPLNPNRCVGQIISNLHRYAREIGANEDLLALLINSLEDWDNKMQIECAQGFLAPIREDVRTISDHGSVAP